MKKRNWQQLLFVLVFILIGAACGIFAVKYIEASGVTKRSTADKIFCYAVFFVELYLAYLLHIIIHEAGHLLFGSLTGYKLSSFRIGSFMWLKENGQVKFKRLTIAGTGGQCLMSPPDIKDGKIPVVLYNLGGPFMNIIVGGVCLCLFFLTGDVFLVSAFFVLMAVIGFAVGALNGIPMRIGTIDNDGYNAFSMTRSRDSMYSFWLQMKINEQISRGIRLKDMPEEWFKIPSEEKMKNSMTAAVGVFATNRLMDEQRFEEAVEVMKKIIEADTAMAGLHRNLMICDIMYCEIIEGADKEAIKGRLDDEQKTFMKSMKKFPSVLRTEYAYALIVENDSHKALRIKEEFEKVARTYPYECDIESERELIDIARKKKEELISGEAVKEGDTEEKENGERKSEENESYK